MSDFYQFKNQITIDEILNPDTWYGKMCKEHLVQTEERTSELCSKKRQKLQKGVPLFLNLQRANGANLDVLWETDGASLGDYMTHSFGESPREEKESRLSQILEDLPHPKYSLSEKACLGILNRANRKGKKLPEPLQKALEEQAKALPILSKSGGGSDTYIKSDGSVGTAGKGALIQKELSGTLGVSQDQTLFTKVYGICSFDSNAMKSNNPKSGIYEADSARTLDFNGGNPACNQGGMAVVQNVSKNKVEEEKAQTIVSREQEGGNDTVGALCACDCKGAGNQYVNDGKLVLQQRRVEKCLDEITDPLTSTDYKEPMKICNNSVVRRLTPTECERLQGYPDNWTNIGEWIDSKGKKHKDADSPRYKALGNSIALPFWDWMAERMCNKLREDGNNDLKMASLFDGIGGFPLVYQKHGCKPVWASEIEEFPIAVTKIRFKEESED